MVFALGLLVCFGQRRPDKSQSLRVANHLADGQSAPQRDLTMTCGGEQRAQRAAKNGKRGPGVIIGPGQDGVGKVSHSDKRSVRTRDLSIQDP